MKKNRLPLSETPVSVNKSMAEIHVKSGCIAVQYGVADVPDIFAGYLAMNTGETLGNQIKTAAAEGKLSKGSIAGLLE